MNKKRKSEIILSAKNINTGFISGNSFVSINKDISFDLYSGQILVIIGESGSGKSVLSKSFGGMNDESFFFSSGSLKYFKDKKPIELVDIFNSSNSGYYSKKMKKIYKNKLNKLSEEINVKNQDKNQNIVELNFLKNDYLQLNNEYINFGKTTKKYSKHDASKLIRKIRGKEISYVFQDPALALNPLLTVGQQITEVLKIHRNLKGKEAYNEAINLLQKVGIINPEKAIKMLPSEYSGGMRQRIVIAIALASNPKILIADEPTTALDVTIQKQIIQLLLNLKRELNIAIIFITHDLGVVAEIANSICVMYNGTFIEKGTKKDIFLNPKHPYTWALISSIPQFSKKTDNLFYLKGSPLPSNFSIDYDPFAPRNENALKIDFQYFPPTFKISSTHFVKSWLYSKYSPAFEIPKTVSDAISYLKGVIK